MMEHVTEFLKDLRERFASPFFFSFLLAWILWNWQVSVALVWYNPELYPFKGDLLEFIDANTDNCRSIWYPLISAALYVGLFKNLVSAFVSFAVTWGEKLNLRITKDSSVPMSKFLEYRKMYVRSHQQLEKVIADESKTIQNYEALQLNKSQVDAENVTLKSEVARLKTTNEQLSLKQAELTATLEQIKENSVSDVTLKDFRFMNGDWKFRYDNKIRGAHFEQMFHIHDGVISVRKESFSEEVYRFVHFFHDKNNKKIFLVLNFIAGTNERNTIQKLYANKIQNPTDVERSTFLRLQSEPVLIHDLDVKDSSTLTGTENVEALVTYTRLTIKTSTFNISE